jgi:hypothetical protein
MKINIAKDGKIKPFDFSDSPVSVPGEGSVFIMLSKEKGGNNYGKVDETSFSQKITGHPDFFVIDADGMNGDETGYKELIGYDAELKGYSPVFGSMPTGSAFNFAAASLMLKNQIAYDCTFRDNSSEVSLRSSTSQLFVNSINCIKICGREKISTIKIQK